MPKKKLTYTFIKTATSDGKSRVEYSDSQAKGLVFRITKTGTKTFSFRYTFKGKDRRYTIGEYPALTLGEARQKVTDLRGIVDQGKDPQYEKLIDKKRATPPIVEELAAEFIKKHVSRLRPSTQNSYTHRINSKIVPEFGKYRLEDLNRKIISDYLEEMVFEDGQDVNANRVRAIFSSMLSFGMDKGLVDHNVVKSIRPIGKEHSRDRVYTDEEVKALWSAFGELQHTVGSLFKFYLLTGQRKTETQRMQWNHIEGDVWKLPSENTKADRAHYVPLNEMALNIIEGLQPLTGESPWVFESFYHPGKPLTHVPGSVKTVQEISGIDDFRLHDLRRTLASNLAGLSIDRTTVGKLLNHKGLSGDSAITGVYDRYDYMKEKRMALQEWEHRLMELIGGTEPDKVI
ncbi:MAG: integrase arm-type DNA-binding domain-containing protein [Spirochaeta sp.]|nr:integrase arm-type DNA-binding domain-containing protein [Spirochaeta sp.]